MKLIHSVLLAASAAGAARAQAPLDDGIAVVVNACDPASPTQKWDISGEHIVLRNFTGKCLDIADYATADGSTVQEYACHPEDKQPAHQNQQWTFKPAAGGTVVVAVAADGVAKGKVLDVNNYGEDGPGSKVQIFTEGGPTGPSTGTPNQHWAYDATSGMLKSAQVRYNKSALCLDVAVPKPTPRACDVEPAKSSPWCDAGLDLEKRLDDLIPRIPADEVVGLFDNGGKGVPSLNISAYQWWSEGLHGVAHSPGVHFGGPVPNATSFPQVVTTSASLNTSLFKLIGQTISTEARAFNNYGRAGNTFWTPNINIFRDPRWGRGQETPGEDPSVNSEYAINFVQGMQEGESWPKYIKASACLKHYAGYNLENSDGVDRHHFNAVITAQDLNDTYLPAFEAGVVHGQASGMMCSYNAVNGVPSCANKWLMTDLARKAWGFDGYITSDCGAVNDVQNSHKYFNNSDATSFGVLDAGMDQDCGGFLGGNLGAAIADGSVPKETYETALRNMFRVRMRMGQFDPLSAQPYTQLDASDVNTPAAQALALEAARQGMVLLKNVDGTLPLKAGDLKTVAVVGPHGQATTVMQGNYNGIAPYLISPQQGLQDALPGAKVEFEAGCGIDDHSTSGFKAAEQAAAAADATVIVLGLTQKQESEGHDRTSIELPGVQHDFIKAVAAAAQEAGKKPAVLVVMAGSSVDLSAERDNPAVGAIVFAGYPGQSGGTALAETLLGAHNPAGRLTQTFYPANFTRAVSMLDMNMRPNATTGYPGRTHRFYTGPTVFKFGDGGSYSSFGVTLPAYAGALVLHVPLEAVEAAVARWALGAPRRRTDRDVTVPVRVENQGPLRGSRAVLGFLVPPGAGTDGRPLQELASFARVHELEVGAASTVELGMDHLAFTLVDATGRRFAEAGDWTLKVDDDVSLTVRVE